MSTNTYVALATTTLGSSSADITITGISQSYTDLVLVVSARSTYAAAEVAGFIRVGNGSIDTGNNYSSTRLLGTGSSASSARATNVSRVVWDAIPGSTSASGNFCTTIISIQNYSNTTTYKTLLVRSNEPNNYVEATVGTWRNTAAINQIRIYGDGAADLAAGSTVTIYGIAATSVGAKATGGTIYSDDLYYYHVFGSTGTFTPLASLSADVLVVAGGGGGGCNRAGGGGAGGLLAYTSQSLTATGYSITVGAGGAGSSSTSAKGTSGSNSQFAALTASVGGGGGGSQTSQTGATGGSGGGGGYDNSAGGSATSGQGFAGGSGGTDSATWRSGGGGGGASAVGTAGTAGGGGTGQGGAGGAGSNTYSSWLSATGFGVSGFIAGGGGGGSGTSPATAALGGSGGGGNGAVYDGAASVAGTIYTGSGGGGGGFNTTPNGASGGSGLVIVRYAK